MASSSSSSTMPADGLTPAQRMMQQHASHQPTIEDVPDEADLLTTNPEPTPAATAAPPDVAVVANGTPMSAKAAGKQRAQEPTPLVEKTNKPPQSTPLDTQSEEAFPALAPSKAKPPPAMGGWGTRPASALAAGPVPNGASMRSNISSQPSSKPTSAAATPQSATPGATPRIPFAATMAKGPAHQVSLPGRYAEDMQMPVRSLRRDLKKPFADILRDMNKRSKAKVDMTSTNDIVTFRGQGPTQESVQEILKEVAAQVGKKESIKVSIPSSLRALIIGKQGATIQNISKRSGARVQMPKADPSSTSFDDDADDSMVDVDIEGNPIAVRLAKNEIEAIVNQRTSTVNLRLKDIPAEFFPFIAGPRNARISELESRRDIRVKVPHYYEWKHQAPPEAFGSEQTLPFAPQDGHHIHITGDRDSAKQAQAEIERQVAELQSLLTVSHIPGIERGRHQFMLGEQGANLHDFLEETGCTIVLPPDTHDTETIAVVGPPNQIEDATERAMGLAARMNITNVDVARQHPGSRQEAHSHARDLARYLRQRRALQRFEDQYKAQFMLPTAQSSTDPWQIYTLEPEAGMRARTGVLNLVSAHPPSRFRNVEVHPFYQRGLQTRHAQQLRDQHGVHVVIPAEDNDGDDESSQVLLVYESPSSAEDYVFPQKKPSPAEVAEFERALQEAESSLLQLIGEQEQIVQRSVETPSKYREKMSRFITRDQQREPAEIYPVQFFGLDSSTAANGADIPVELRGPTNAVDEYFNKLTAFIEEQIRDEAERDYKVTCEFPQKFANILIGRRGENINKLRDEFDVDIQVKDGNVEIQGPKPKADAARAHIISMAKKLEDETTHILKIEPKFHRDLIGSKGAQVLKLEDRYNVRIQFPRSASSAPDDESLLDGTSDAGASAKRRGPALGPDEIRIKGPKRGADEARDEIWALYQYSKELAHTATVSVSQSQIPSLIGQGGRELQALRDTTGADIDVPGRDTVDTSGRVEIKLKGRKEAVANAKKIIESKVKAFDETVRRTIDIDRAHHGPLIGSNGENIRQIILSAGGSGDAQQLGQMVQFPKPHATESAIRVEGDKDTVDKIVKAIEEFVQLRENQVTETIEVPPERHGALIGRGGQVRKTLEAENNITLNVPPTTATGAARSQIKIIGLPADIAKAKEKINAILNERKGETVLIPIRMHHTIADNGGFFRTLRNDLQVTVDHQGRRPPRPEAAAVSKPNLPLDSFPLITDEASGPADLSPEEIESKLIWEISPSIGMAEAEAENPTIPWVLKGDSEAVVKAKTMIEAAMIAAEKSVTGYLVLPDPRLHKSIIGPGGSTVNKIRKTTNCKIDVPKAGESGAIEIRGTAEKVEEAKSMILEALSEAPSRRL